MTCLQTCLQFQQLQHPLLIVEGHLRSIIFASATLKDLDLDKSRVKKWWFNQCETNRRFPPCNSFQLDTSWYIQSGFHEQSRFTWPESISRMNVWFCLNVFLVLHYGTLWISFSRACVVEDLLALLQRSTEYTLYYAILPGCQVRGIKVFRLACTLSLLCRESKSLTSCSGGILRLLAVAQEDGAEGTGPHRLSQDVMVLQHKCRKSTGSLLWKLPQSSQLYHANPCHPFSTPSNKFHFRRVATSSLVPWLEAHRLQTPLQHDIWRPRKKRTATHGWEKISRTLGVFHLTSLLARMCGPKDV